MASAERPSKTRQWIQWLGLVTGPALAVICYVLLPDHYASAASEQDVPFTHAGRATLGIMVWMATWWLTEAIDISATALLPLALFPIAGVATIQHSAAPYGSEFIFLFMGGFILALSMQRWGLDKRIALITLRMVGARPHNMVGGFMLATAVLSGFVSNTATAAMMLPVALSVVALMMGSGDSSEVAPSALDASSNNRPLEGEVTSASSQHQHSSNFALCLMLGVAYAASIGGLATVIGSPPNVFLVSFARSGIDPAFQEDITFVKWLGIGVPLVAVFLPITWFMLTRVLYPIRLDAARLQQHGRSFIARAYQQLGPMKRGEWSTFIVFLCAAMLWMFRPWIAAIEFGFGDDRLRPFAGLSDAGIAIMAAMALFIIPVQVRSLRFTMDWPTAAKLPWGVLILFGGGLSLAAAIQVNGVAEFIGAQAQQFAGLPPLVLVLIVTMAVIFFSELASNTATATTLVPILAAMAPGLEVDPYLLIIPATIAASCAFMLPVGTPPNAIVFGTGYVTMPQMMKAGIWLNLIGIVLITLLMFVIVKPLILN